ncbi:gamma-glutamylcyclotransferase [Cytobacillus sp. FJAT-54145]|uniref:Gamma-glutamylcyclotransferase n=1 Tax=Cytobacillus spartinae TaxID=3299023 RepID=A0ABW6K8A8_9BACI
MKNTFKLFVYGTLRKHGKYHELLKDARCLVEQAWIYGELYDTGLGYPTMMPSEDKVVYGEMYEINNEQLWQIDKLEDYVAGRSNNLYERVTYNVFTDQDSLEAYIYVSNRKDLHVTPIPHGDWKLYTFLKEKPETFYYFAYGSCMDTERFRLANVDHYFSNVIGVGMLEQYSMKYLYSVSDGGRADIVEDGGLTEGIVYEAPYDAVQYLFKREGFYTRAYRPIFVDIKMKDTILKDVLTFHVYDKREETVPPHHYATEILRGAKGRVSSKYFEYLRNELVRLGIEDIEKVGG